MRLAILIYSLSDGGAERAATQLANFWADQGDEVFIITYGGDAHSDYPLWEGVRVHPLRTSGAPDSGPLAAMMRLTRVRAALRAVQPDVAVGFMSQANVLLALASLGMAWRTVGGERSAPKWEPSSRVWRALRALTYGLLDRVCAQTRSAADWLERHTTARKVFVAPNAVTWPLIDGRPDVLPASLVASDRRMLLAAGRFTALKGFVNLVDCFAAVASRHPDWDLAIAGDGEERPLVEGRIAELGLAWRVHLPGRVANMGEWYERADLFALSSKYEGFPNVMLEAMAYGVPVVSFDCDDGPRDIIRDGVDGVLVPAGDLLPFTDALDRLMGDDEGRQRMGARGKDVRQRFSNEVVMSLWRRLLWKDE